MLPLLKRLKIKSASFFKVFLLPKRNYETGRLNILNNKKKITTYIVNTHTLFR